MKRRSSGRCSRHWRRSATITTVLREFSWLCVILQQLLDATKPHLKVKDNVEIQLGPDHGAEARIFASVGVTAAGQRQCM